MDAVYEGPLAVELDVVHDEAGLIGNPHRDHREPMGRRRPRLGRAMRWNAGRHDPDLIERQRETRGVRHREVAEMERVERAPDETDAARRRHSSRSG